MSPPDISLHGAPYSVYTRIIRLYETSAIARFLDEHAPAPPLQPATPLARARMNTLISLMDNYAFRAIVWGVFVERVRKPLQGGEPDEAVIVAGLDTAKTLLLEMTRALASSPWLAGDQLTLADLWAGPMFILFDRAAEGRAAIDTTPPVRRWLETFKGRPSAVATRFPIEAATT